MSQMKAADLAVVKSLPGNDRCAECPMKHPQWASVSFGTLFCLECSGIHRSLGVHISFVRSIAMDAWTDQQIALMKAGGNDKCNAYLKENGISPTNYSTQDAVNGGIKKKYDNDVALLYKLKLKARVEGKPEPTSVPQKKKKPSTPSSSFSATSASASATSAGGGSNDPNGMERLAGETDAQYIARQTRLREEAKARMAAKFGNNGMAGGKRVMGGVGSSPHPSQQSGMGAFNLDSFTTGLASVTSTAATGLGSAWSLAKDTVNQTTNSGGGSSSSSKNVGAGASASSSVSELGSTLWSSISQVSNNVAKEINAVVATNDNSNAFSDLSQRMRAQRMNSSKSNSTYAGFGSQDLIAKSNAASTTRATASASASAATSPSGDENGIAALPNETDQQYMERQLRIQQEAKARMAAKFGNNPGQAMKSMSVGTNKSTAKPKVSKPVSTTDDFFASFGT